MTEHPNEPTAPYEGWPVGSDAGESYGRENPGSTADLTSDETKMHWTPLLPRTGFAVVLAFGVVVGIAGPILLWLNLAYVNKETPFHQRVGYLLLLIGLGILIIALPLVLGEAARLERGSARGPIESRADLARTVTGTRVFALLGVVILLAGVFLIRPIEPSDPATSGGSSQGGGRGNG